MNLNTIILGNTIEEYFIAVLVFMLVSLALKFIKNRVIHYLEKLFKKTANKYDDMFIDMLKSIKPFFYSYLGFYVALQFINIGTTLGNIADGLMVALVVIQSILALNVGIDFFLQKKMVDTELQISTNNTNTVEDPSRRNAVGFLSGILKGALWVFGFVLLLSNFGVNVTSLIAGLGIGGIAIALAVQNILGDLFSSFAIYFDKPFEVGDVIQVGQERGTVEKIGIKTTRIRSLQGEEIVISNKELTSARIQNYRRLSERRGDLLFGVLYETPAEKIKNIPEIVKNVIDPISGVRFGRCHFKNFGDSSLNFECVYHVESQDYDIFMDIKQEINQKVLEKFNQEGIGMAYPTRTVYMAGSNT